MKQKGENTFLQGWAGGQRRLASLNLRRGQHHMTILANSKPHEATHTSCCTKPWYKQLLTLGESFIFILFLFTEYRDSNKSRAFILTVASDVVHIIRGRKAILVFHCFRYKSSQDENEWHHYQQWGMIWLRGTGVSRAQTTEEAEPHSVLLPHLLPHHKLTRRSLVQGRCVCQFHWHRSFGYHLNSILNFGCHISELRKAN